MEISDDCLNVFSKTRYSLSEEDRAVNGLLVLLKHCSSSLLQGFLNEIGISLDTRTRVSLREHVGYGPDCIVDAEIVASERLVLFIEAKIYQDGFTTVDQVEKYFQLLQYRSENRRYLLLLSPDSQVPSIAHEILGQKENCRIEWRSWIDIFTLIRNHYELIDESEELASFLCTQYLEYLSELGIAGLANKHDLQQTKLEPQLRCLLGGGAKERILLHLFHHHRAHLSAMARDQGVSASSLQRDLANMVKAGILKREREGHQVIYSFNDGSRLLPGMLEMLRVVYSEIPSDMKERIFNPRYALKE